MVRAWAGSLDTAGSRALEGKHTLGTAVAAVAGRDGRKRRSGR